MDYSLFFYAKPNCVLSTPKMHSMSHGELTIFVFLKFEIHSQCNQTTQFQCFWFQRSKKAMED